MEIVYFDEMINIDVKDQIRYALIKDMYTVGDGYGLQCNFKEDSEKYKELKTLLDNISENIIKINRILGE